VSYGTTTPPERKQRIADWEPTLRVFTTPAVIEIPQGQEWQITQVLAPPPPGWPSAAPLDVEQYDAEQDPDRGLILLEADAGVAFGPDGRAIPEMAGKVPPSIMSFSLYSLRQAAWKLTRLEDHLHVGRAHRLLGFLEENLRERGPSVPGLAALEEALHLARLAWMAYSAEVCQPILQCLPFHVSAERRPRRITVRHVELLLGGSVTHELPDLPPVQVEIAAYVKTPGPEFTYPVLVGEVPR
jgi:hypothetical protein